MLPDSASRARKTEAEQKTLQGSAMLVSSLKALTVLSACKASTETSASAQPPVKGFGQEQAHAVADALFSNVVATNHPQSLRFIIYRLLDSLVAHHRDALKAYRPSSSEAADVPASEPTTSASTPMEVDTSSDEAANAARSETCQGKPFLQGYVKMVQGEKDPRNLMVLFGVDKVLLTEWVMDREMTEKFFDITFCYFPITFRPPPDDPYGITSDDLKVALRAAICASPAMAPLGYPLLLEKLSAAGGPAKRTRCVPSLLLCQSSLRPRQLSPMPTSSGRVSRSKSSTLPTMRQAIWQSTRSPRFYTCCTTASIRPRA